MLHAFLSQFWAELAVAGIVGLVGWVVVSSRRQGRTDARVSATNARIASHEEDCAKYRKETREGIKELKDLLLDQNEQSTAHRQATAITLGEIEKTVARLDENRRMRERLEDRE